MGGQVDTEGAGGRADDDIFAQAELWPVRLTFLTANGLTLWGPGGGQDGHDRVLTLEGRLVLAGSQAALHAFVAHDESSSMVGLPGYALLQRRVRDGTVQLEEQVAFDYRAVAHALDWPPDRWDLKACSDLVDALNMLADLGEALQDDELLARFNRPAYVSILGRLTFLTEEEVPEAVTALDRPALRQIVGMGIDHIERRIAPLQ